MSGADGDIKEVVARPTEPRFTRLGPSGFDP
jgi:hypothetical protein